MHLSFIRNPYQLCNDSWIYRCLDKNHYILWYSSYNICKRLDSSLSFKISGSFIHLLLLWLKSGLQRMVKLFVRLKINHFHMRWLNWKIISGCEMAISVVFKFKTHLKTRFILSLLFILKINNRYDSLKIGVGVTVAIPRSILLNVKITWGLHRLLKAIGDITDDSNNIGDRDGKAWITRQSYKRWSSESQWLLYLQT